MSVEQPPEVIRHYTSTRRIPLMFGRLTDGMRIPGGPYSATQFLAGGVVLMLGNLTRPVWSFGSELTDYALLIALVVGAIFFTGRLPITSRHPIWAVVGAWTAFTESTSGTIAGRSFSLPKPTRADTDARSLAAARELMSAPLPPAPAEPLEPEREPEPAVGIAAQLEPPVALAATGVDRLRALAAGRKDQ